MFTTTEDLNCHLVILTKTKSNPNTPDPNITVLLKALGKNLTWQLPSLPAGLQSSIHHLMTSLGLIKVLT